MRYPDVGFVCDMDIKGFTVISLAILSAISLAIVFIFSGFAVRGQFFFENSIGNISDTYRTYVSPARYRPDAFISGVVYFWSTAWIVYALAGICRRNIYGRVILNPVILTIPVLLCWIVSCIANIVWLVVWTRAELFVSFIVMLVSTLSGYVTIAFLVFATEEKKKLLQRDSEADLTLIYALIHNGIDVFVSWTTIATLVHLSIFLTYDPIVKPNMSNDNASTIAISVLIGFVVIWSVLENTIFFKYVRFLYAWYGVVIWAGIEILLAKFDISDTNTILTITLIPVAVVCLIIKIAVSNLRKTQVQSTELTWYK